MCFLTKLIVMYCVVYSGKLSRHFFKKKKNHLDVCYKLWFDYFFTDRREQFTED